MAIQSVDLTKALNNEAYAAQVIRSGKCDSSQRIQLVAQWGADKISQWESVDSTQYEITDADKASARAKGDEKVNEATDGFDGKSDGTKSAAMGTVSAAGGVAGAVMGVVTAITQLFSHGKYVSNPFISAVIGTILLANSIMLKAFAPNKEQAQACDDLAPVMQESQSELDEQQGILSETTNAITESTDEMDKASEEANKATEKQQAEYEKLQARYQELVAKQEAAKTGGEPLTEAEKAEFQQLSGLLGTKFEELNTIKAEGDEKLEDLKANVEEQQEVYDTTAEKIEEVKEITEFSAGFDEATVDNAKLVKTAAKIGVLGAAGVVASGVQGVATAGLNLAQHIAGGVAIATGGASGVILTGVVKDQNDYQSRAEAGVDNRVATEDVNNDTTDLYDEELDNYSANIDFLDEMEFTQTTATETQIVGLSNTTAPAEKDEDNKEKTSSTSAQNSNPFAAPSANNTGGTGNDDAATVNPSGGKVDKDKDV